MQHTYHVTVRPDGQWQGGKEKAVVPYFLADTQQEAEEMMCGIATRMGRSQVWIFNAQDELLRVRVFGTAQVGPEALLRMHPVPGGPDVHQFAYEDACPPS